MPENRHMIPFIHPGRFRYLIGGVKPPPYRSGTARRPFPTVLLWCAHPLGGGNPSHAAGGEQSAPAVGRRLSAAGEIHFTGEM